MVDDKLVIILPGETAGESKFFGVRGVDGVGVTENPPIYAAREGNRR